MYNFQTNTLERKDQKMSDLLRGREEEKVR